MMLALSIAVSFAGLLAMSRGDPKRLRAAVRLGGVRRRALTRKSRALLAALAFAPGLALACTGQWASFLVWMSAATALGWALAQVLSPSPQSP